MAEPDRASRPVWYALVERTSLCILLGVILVVMLAPVKIAGYGGCPNDDVLRHVAKVYVDKDWEDILVFRPGLYAGMDTQPGWHAFLGAVKRLLGCSRDSLVVFSICFLWSLLLFSLLIHLKRPEALALVLLAWYLCEPMGLFRFLYGRPFLVAGALLIHMLLFWKPLVQGRHPKAILAGIGMLVALTVWMQSAWYLLSLPLLAVLATREWKRAFQVIAVTLVGIIVGSILTGHPLEYLEYQLRVSLLALGGSAKSANLVMEFQAADTNAFLAVVLAGWLLFRWRNPGLAGESLRHPAFHLGIAGWILGFVVGRFWYDWGAPALMVWLALELQALCEQVLPRVSWQRLVVGMLACACFYFAFVSNPNDRYGNNPNRKLDHLVQAPEAFQGWLPEAGGIVYSPNMQVFYCFFYQYPDAPWRYLLGFEPGLMPDADVAVYRQFLSQSNWAIFQTWVDRMTWRDRFIVMTERTDAPPLEHLEWKRVPPGLWIGRLETRSAWEGSRSSPLPGQATAP